MQNTVIILLLSFIFSDNIFYDSYLVQSKTLIVKFSEHYAPKLWKENPVSLNDIKNIDNSHNFRALSPLFSTIKQYTDLHYKYNLHQFYRLELNENDNSFDRIINNLKNLDIIENVTTNGMENTLLVPND